MAPTTTTARSARILTLPPPVQPTLPQLQVHSQFSRRFGASTVTALVQAACDAQVPALALTDRNAMQGQRQRFISADAHFVCRPRPHRP